MRVLSVDERKRLAIKWVKAINRLPDYGLKLVFRSIGEFGGVIYDIERVRENHGDVRLLARIIDKDGNEVTEYLDRKADPNGKVLDDVVILRFDGSAILSARKRPGLSDSDDEFEFLMPAHLSDYYVQLKDEIERRNNEIQELRFRLEEALSTINWQDKEIETLNERVRRLEEDKAHLSRENVRLKEIIVDLEILVKKHMAVGAISTTAVDEILRRAKAAGVTRVLGGYEAIEEILRRDKQIAETAMAIGGGLDLVDVTKNYASLSEDVRVLREQVAKILNMIGEREKEEKKEERSEKQEVEVEAGV
ncbi:MAG: hypothetical protein ACXQS2_03625 [Methermicoccaceae archaeon]